MPTTAPSIPVSDIDPFSTEFLSDPLPLHEELRELGPVVYLPRYDVHAVARYDDVHRALTDWQSLQSGAGVGLSNFNHEAPWRPPSLLLEADPPRHDAPRAVLSQLLSPRRLRSLESRWQADAVALVERVLSEGHEFDAVTSLAEPFPLRVFPDAVGIGTHNRENLLPYGDFAFNAFGPMNERVTDPAKTIGPTVEWIAAQCRRENLSETGFGAQIWEAADRGEIGYEQAPLIVRSLLTAGVDTTVTGISAVLHAVATHPDQWQRLRAERELLPRAFEEAIRLESPVQTFFRTTTVETRIADTVLAPERKVLMFLGAANHDPRRWNEPERFDLSRDPSGHVGFGMGIHQCVGQHIARLEAVTLLDALLDRVSSIELAGAPRRHLNNTLRGWESMPVRVVV
ncbi:cytochrome P450 [Microbacterium sp. A196]|uniref:cytochrome P450 n=1 Tax=Microbacterium sp. A196 TaxID=3457320 RepID=UPI003FD44FA0